MSNEESWNFFGRIETLEQTAKRFKATEAASEEAWKIALVAFHIAVGAMFLYVPQQARAFKDTIMSNLEHIDLSRQTLDALEQIMLDVCDSLDRTKTPK